jgi:hypothetical protein
MVEPHNMENLMCVHMENLRKQVTNPFRRTWWEPQNSELDVNKLRTWWEHDEQHTLRTWGTGYKPIQKNMVGTSKFRTWCEQIENLMGTWWATHFANLRNRLQTHSEEHGGNLKIQNLMWTNWKPDGNMMSNTLCKLEEQVTNPFRRTWWEPQNSELDVNKLRTWWEHDEQHTLRSWWEHDEQHTLRT